MNMPCSQCILKPNDLNDFQSLLDCAKPGQVGPPLTTSGGLTVPADAAFLRVLSFPKSARGDIHASSPAGVVLSPDATESAEAGHFPNP